MTVQFVKLSKEDSYTMYLIVRRAVDDKVISVAGSFEKAKEKILSLEMDLTAVAYLCPLDWDRLIAFDAFNFSHDILGIINNIDRSTGKLKNHFLPRCAKQSRSL